MMKRYNYLFLLLVTLCSSLVMTMTTGITTMDTMATTGATVTTEATSQKIR